MAQIASERVLVQAPVGRDADAIMGVLRSVGLSGVACVGLGQLLSHLSAGAGVAIVSEEALARSELGPLEKWIAEQDPWSDFPLLILTSSHTTQPAYVLRQTLVEKLGNVALLARPLSAISLVSAVQSSLRARRRQYEVRDHILDQQRSAATLAQLVNDRTRQLVELARAEAAVRQSESRFRGLIEQAADGILVTSVDGRYIDVNPAGCDLLGMTRDEVLASKFTDVIAPEEHHRLEAAIAAFADGQVHRDEWQFRRKDGSGFIGELAGRQLADGRFQGVLRDTTARRQSEETQQLLLGELNHRVKNMLATVQSIVQMTLRHTKDPAVFAKAFAGRVQSLARVHSVLTEATWQGADLRALIRDQLLSGVMEERQLDASGDHVNLPPQLALQVALMLHELGTNAAKYGALSVDAGTIAIRWTMRDGLLKLSWIERNGPPVKAPSRRGFGSTLIELTAKGTGGAAQATWEGTGVMWDIELPLPQNSTAISTQRAGKEGSAASTLAASETQKGDLTGRRLLVIEDEPLVAMDNAAVLESVGATVVGTAGSIKDALRVIGEMELDGALLDGNLHGKPVDEIAAALSGRGVPFIFVSGYGRETLPRAFATAPLLGKPFSPEQLVESVGTMLRKAASCFPASTLTTRKT